MMVEFSEAQVRKMRRALRQAAATADRRTYNKLRLVSVEIGKAEQRSKGKIQFN